MHHLNAIASGGVDSDNNTNNNNNKRIKFNNNNSNNNKEENVQQLMEEEDNYQQVVEDKMNNWIDLPNDIWFLIFSYLSWYDILNKNKLFILNKNFNYLIMNLNILWKNFNKECFSISEFIKDEENDNLLYIKENLNILNILDYENLYFFNENTKLNLQKIIEKESNLILSLLQKNNYSEKSIFEFFVKIYLQNNLENKNENYLDAQNKFTKLKKLINQLELYLLQNNPAIHQTLQFLTNSNITIKQFIQKINKQKLTFKELSNILNQHTLQQNTQQPLQQTLQQQYIPIDFQLFYLLLNGQHFTKNNNNNNTLGLFGGYEFYTYHANIQLFSLQESLIYYKRFIEEEMDIPSYYKKNCLPFAGGSNVILFIVLKDFSVNNNPIDNEDDDDEVAEEGNMTMEEGFNEEGNTEGNDNRFVFKVGNVVQLSGEGAPFLLHESFLGFIEKYIINLTEKNLFSIYQETNEIIRFPRDTIISKGSDTITNGVRIQCNAIVVPELSRISKDPSSLLYHFSYRIRITMDKKERLDNTCKLESRHWEIIEGDNLNKEQGEIVEGPGVVGLFPKVSPGSYFEYQSCTQSSERIGYMKGYFTMKNLKTGERFKAMIDPFQLTVENHL
ncbi:hypothetical protein ABK040_007559 [Willaertia magna]